MTTNNAHIFPADQAICNAPLMSAITTRKRERSSHLLVPFVMLNNRPFCDFAVRMRQFRHTLAVAFEILETMRSVASRYSRNVRGESSPACIFRNLDVRNLLANAAIVSSSARHSPQPAVIFDALELAMDTTPPSAKVTQPPTNLHCPMTGRVSIKREIFVGLPWSFRRFASSAFGSRIDTHGIDLLDSTVGICRTRLNAGGLLAAVR